MQLVELLRQVPAARLVGGPAGVEITGITHDSRAANTGCLFVAIPGMREDGRKFILDAVARGAVAVAGRDLPPPPPAIAHIEVADPRLALADLSAAFFGHPSRQLKLVGVTGTDGKTTTTRLIASILGYAGLKTGWLTTVDIKIGDHRTLNQYHHTTPEAPTIQEVLARMVAAGVTHAALEVSSHALVMHRVRGCDFDVAVFTNLSPEHLNFHRTFDEYRLAKSRLFSMLRRDGGIGVVNADDASAPFMVAACRAPVIGYGSKGVGQVRAVDIETSIDSTRFTLELDVPGLASLGITLPRAAARVPLTTRLIGGFNIYNWLAAISAALALGADLEAVREACQQVEPVPGRMEFIRAGQPFSLVVDFCHTPQAMENALHTLRPLTPGRLLVVFGLPGGRDRSNRPKMGALAATQSDFFVITTDDPYHEDPAEIAREIALGAQAVGAQEGRHYQVELDRRAAFRIVLSMARPGDTVLLAGKGHESRQVIGDHYLSWSEHRVAREVLAELGYGPDSIA